MTNIIYYNWGLNHNNKVINNHLFLWQTLIVLCYFEGLNFCSRLHKVGCNIWILIKIFDKYLFRTISSLLYKCIPRRITETELIFGLSICFFYINAKFIWTKLKLKFLLNQFKTFNYKQGLFIIESTLLQRCLSSVLSSFHKGTGKWFSHSHEKHSFGVILKK